MKKLVKDKNGKIMEDGLYRVMTKYLCAGFAIEKGLLTWCAPVLKNKFDYWKTVAVKIKNE